MSGAPRFGQLMREARIRAGMTLGEFSRHLGLSKSFVSDVEVSRRLPFKPDDISRAAHLLRADEEAMQLAAMAERESGGVCVPVMTRHDREAAAAFIREAVRRSSRAYLEGAEERGLKLIAAALCGDVPAGTLGDELDGVAK